MEELLLNLPERSRNSWLEAPLPGASRRASGRPVALSVSFPAEELTELTELSSLTDASRGRPRARSLSNSLVSSNGLPFSPTTSRTETRLEKRTADRAAPSLPAAPTNTPRSWIRVPHLLVLSFRHRSTKVTRLDRAAELGLGCVAMEPGRVEAV